MAKDKTIYTCNECGGTCPKWLGKCPHCQAWNTLVESVAEPVAASKNNRFAALAKTAEVMALADIEATDMDRTPTGLDELDRVLEVALPVLRASARAGHCTHTRGYTQPAWHVGLGAGVTETNVRKNPESGHNLNQPAWGAEAIPCISTNGHRGRWFSPTRFIRRV